MAAKRKPIVVFDDGTVRVTVKNDDAIIEIANDRDAVGNPRWHQNEPGWNGNTYERQTWDRAKRALAIIGYRLYTYDKILPKHLAKASSELRSMSDLLVKEDGSDG